MDWSYIAGLFDGEGNIHFNKVRGRFYILSRIYSSNEKALLRIKEFIGFGSIYMAKTGVFELTIIKKENNLSFLRAILPHTLIKKEIINFVLENYKFNYGDNNSGFDIVKFHSLVTRKNVEKYRRKAI